MHRAHALWSAVAILVVVAAGWGAAVPSAHAAPQEASAEPSHVPIQLDVEVTRTGGHVGTAGDTGEEPHTWRVSTMTTEGRLLVWHSEGANLRATASVVDDGRIAVDLNVTVRGAAPGVPVVKASVAVVLEDGEPTIVAEAANGNGNGTGDSQVAVEVTATALDGAADRRASGAGVPVRVGGGVPPPRKIHDVSPIYPSAARTLQVQGVVILEATIDPMGEVVDVKVLRSVPELDAAAVAAVERWRYEPTVVDGVAVPVVMTVTINFSLPSRGTRPAPSPPAPGRPAVTGAGDPPSPGGEPAQPDPRPGR